VMLSPRLLAVLREYWELQRPKPYLFPGRHPDRPISMRTVQMVCERALSASGLSKHVHMHTLRHNADSRIMPTGVRRVIRDPANRAGSSRPEAA
jgi:integrase/recombinase XerD